MSIWQPIVFDRDGTWMLDGERLLAGDRIIVRRRGGGEIEVEWHGDSVGRAVVSIELEVHREEKSTEAFARTPVKKVDLVLFEGTVAAWLKRRGDGRPKQDAD